MDTLPITFGLLLYGGYVLCMIMSADYACNRWGVWIAILVTHALTITYILASCTAYNYAFNPIADSWIKSSTHVVSGMFINNKWAIQMLYSAATVIGVFMFDKKRLRSSRPESLPK